jgi:Glyoxalase-like domain
MSWVHAVVDVPAGALASSADFWGRVLGWRAGEPWRDHPELCSFEPPTGTPYLHLQRIDGSPRVHIDVESDAPDEAVIRAVDLGAELVRESDTWRTLRSPGGLAFCVLRAKEHEPPEAVSHPDGHRTRMVQVCIDSPAAAHDAEVVFWRALLGGRWAESGGPEFAGKWHDDAGSPLQLLFQRLDEADGPVRAHLDLGTDDLPAEVGRLLGLGASDVAAGRGWHVLRDVTGQPFCATLNSPEQTRQRDLG